MSFIYTNTLSNMKKYYLIAIVCIPILSNAQFKTTYNKDGDPQSEIIDDSSMKQGAWTYFDYSGKKIRIEKFKDNKLLSRSHSVSNSKINTQFYIESELNIDSQNKNTYKKQLASFSGELVTDENGGLIEIYFYKIDDENSLLEYKSILKSILETNNSGLKNRILTF